MFDAYQEHCDFNYSTDQEWDRAEARELGENDPTRCWVLTDRDVWHKNPSYRGVEQPHPECDYGDEDDDVWAAWEVEQAAWEAAEKADAEFYHASMIYAQEAQADVLH